MKSQKLRGAIVAGAMVAAVLVVACDNASNRHGGGGAGGTGGGAAGGSGGGGAGGGGGGGMMGDPVTCVDAATQKSYVGCDYWPTVTPNLVASYFDFTVVVANTGTMDAMVTVTGPNAFSQTVTVSASQLQKIYLPWVASLKGADNSCGSGPPLTASTVEHKGAYHLVSSVPVVVYQFNALEYKPQGGPPGKDWSACTNAAAQCGGSFQCFSYSNDASLLLPSTALTGNYRVTGWHSSLGMSHGAFMSITGTADATTVTVKLAAGSNVVAGNGVAAIAGGQTGTYTINQGDVLQLAAVEGSSGIGNDVDATGTLIKADKPVEVIAGDDCANNPAGADACDHIEESVFPAETLGKHYLISAPPGPQGMPVGHTVRLVGNVDGTNLTYNPAVTGAPATLNAGQVVDIGPTTTDFEVTGDHEFAAETVMQGGSIVDPGTPQLMQRGDPSESLFFAVEQFRTAYLFLAPSDYDVNFVDITAPMSAKLVLDGAAVTVTPTPIGTSTYGTFRVPITAASSSGSHTLTSDMPMGIQVLGYGQYTSYQYPGGGNLSLIAPVPIG
ncbi:MAG: IgGFc-binding protein [Myxococcales bacterium]|nr:IgGFc-binding protein [Myxococcales bacterium]